MSVQMPIFIDEATKQRFESICESAGSSSANVIGMFITNVIKSNSIPFDEGAKQPKRIPKLGGWEGKIQMAVDFDASLDLVAVPEQKPKMSREEVFGCARGQFNIPDDFDEPLEDFKEYME